MKYLLSFFVLLVMACGLVMPSPAVAAAPTLIDAQGDWKSYFFLDKGEKVCFMSSQPQKQEGKYNKRGEVFLFVTHWPGEKDKNVVSVSNGYTFKPGSTVTLTIDGRNFSLFTQGEMAWTKDQLVDDAITEALRKGSTVVIKGVSKYDTETTDTYSLKGSGAIYQKIADECSGKGKPPAPVVEEKKPVKKSPQKSKTVKKDKKSK